LVEFKIAASLDLGAAEALELGERDVVVEVAFGGTAVGEGDEAELVHMGVVGGEEDAEIGGDAGEDETADAEVVEEGKERGAIEGGVAGLEDEVVFGAGFEALRDRSAAGAGAGGVGEDGMEVVAPAGEVVVDVDDGDTGDVGLAAGVEERFHELFRPGEDFLTAGELEVADDVDDEEGITAVGSLG
jgi:hypothetical protein